MRVLVVDDEAPARRRLVRQLAAMPEVTVVGQAADGDEALALVVDTKPELLLLDIHMPRLDGLTLVARHHALPPVIFVTAYEAHAVRAFELHAVDYLLKPVRPERLAQALERALARAAPPPAVQRVLDTLAPTGTRVVSTARGVTRLFDALEVTRFWSSEKYTLFVARNEEHMTEEPLGALEARLAPHGFLRVHRGELVNLSSVRALHSDELGLELELADGQRARVSRRTAPAVRAALGV